MTDWNFDDETLKVIKANPKPILRIYDYTFFQKVSPTNFNLIEEMKAKYIKLKMRREAIHPFETVETWNGVGTIEVEKSENEDIVNEDIINIVLKRDIHTLYGNIFMTKKQAVELAAKILDVAGRGREKE